MSRRRSWFGHKGAGRTDLPVAFGGGPGLMWIDTRVVSPAPPAPAAPADAEASGRDLAAENASLKTSRDALQEKLDAELRRITTLTDQAREYRLTIAGLEARHTAMAARLAAAENHVDGTCSDAATVRELRATLAAMQRRLSALQEANEGHDTWARSR